MKALHYILAAAVVFLAACVRHSESGAAMDLADAVMEERPDSALTLLQGIDVSGRDGEEERARYALLMSMALMKESYAVEDTAFIAGALRHYQKGGDTPDHMKSLYLTSDVLHNAGEYGGAMSMLLKAYDIAVKTGDLYWQAKTSELMGDVSSSAYNDADLAEYSMRAADLYDKAGRENNRRYVLVDHAIALANLGETEKALHKIDSIFAIASATEANHSLMAYCRRAKLSILIGCGTRDAITFMESIPEEDIEKIMTAKDHANIARVAINNGDMDRAAVHLKKADSLKASVIDKVAISSAKSEYYAKNNELAAAKIQADSVIFYQNEEVKRVMEQSTVNARSDYLRKKEMDTENKAHRTALILIIVGISSIFIVIGVICIYSLRIKVEKAENMARWHELRMMRDRINAQSEENRLLSGEVAQRDNALREKEQSIYSLEKKIESLKQQTLKLKNTKDALKASVMEKDSRMVAKDEELVGKLREIVALSEKIQELETERESLSERVASGESEREGLRLLLREQTATMEGMNRTMEEQEIKRYYDMWEVFRSGWMILNDLSRNLYNGITTRKENEEIIADMETEIARLKEKKKLEEIEACVNKYQHDIIKKLRAQCGFLNSCDITFLTLVMGGLTVYAVCVILGLTPGNFYTKRRRLKEQIAVSQAPDKDLFISAIGG